MSIDPNLILFLGVIVGLLLGSFLNVVISRFPIMWEKDRHEESRFFLGLPAVKSPGTFNLLYPRSLCTRCNTALLNIDNIPIASYIFLKGRCRYCNARIPIRYPLVEVITVALTLACLANPSSLHPSVPSSALIESIVWLCFCSFLIVLAAIDLEKHLLPDTLTLLLMWLGITAAALRLLDLALYDSVLGAVLGYSVFWIIGESYKLIRKKEGLARGDAKLLAALGAWLGWAELPLLVILSSLIGTIIAGAMIVCNRIDRSEPIPFGPFLACAGLSIMFMGSEFFSQKVSILLF